MIQGKARPRPVEEMLREARAEAICRERPATAFRTASLEGTVERLRGDSGGCVVVVELRGASPYPVGIFTERDYLDKVAGLPPLAWDEARLAPIESYMTPSPRTMPAGESLETAIRLMTAGGYRHLPLVDGSGALVGLLSARDIMHHLAEYFPVEVMNLPPRLHQDERIWSREGG